MVSRKKRKERRGGLSTGRGIAGVLAQRENDQAELLHPHLDIPERTFTVSN